MSKPPASSPLPPPPPSCGLDQQTKPHAAAALGPSFNQQHQQQEQQQPPHWAAATSALGSMLLLSLAAVAAAAPGQLPRTFLLLAALGLPWRMLSFIRRKWAFFLIDYCYVANALVIAFILSGSSLPQRSQSQWLAALYSLSEGPLASALCVWKCAWLPGSVDHVTSVLLHLLPGLVLFSMRHMTPPVPVPASASGLSPGWGEAVTWHLVIPTAVYLTWQALYWFVVQVCCRRWIQAGGYDTSYKALSRRAGRANTYLHRLGRRGGTARRLCIFGGVQLTFSVATFLLGTVTYYSKTLALVWQLVKLCSPLYFGAQIQATRDAELFTFKTLQRLAIGSKPDSKAHHNNACTPRGDLTAAAQRSKDSPTPALPLVHASAWAAPPAAVDDLERVPRQAATRGAAAAVAGSDPSREAATDIQQRVKAAARKPRPRMKSPM